MPDIAPIDDGDRDPRVISIWALIKVGMDMHAAMTCQPGQRFADPDATEPDMATRLDSVRDLLYRLQLEESDDVAAELFDTLLPELCEQVTLDVKSAEHLRTASGHVVEAIETDARRRSAFLVTPISRIDPEQLIRDPLGAFDLGLDCDEWLVRKAPKFREYLTQASRCLAAGLYPPAAALTVVATEQLFRSYFEAVTAGPIPVYSGSDRPKAWTELCRQLVHEGHCSSSRIRPIVTVAKQRNGVLHGDFLLASRETRRVWYQCKAACRGMIDDLRTRGKLATPVIAVHEFEPATISEDLVSTIAEES